MLLLCFCGPQIITSRTNNSRRLYRPDPMTRCPRGGAPLLNRAKFYKPDTVAAGGEASGPSRGFHPVSIRTCLSEGASLRFVANPRVC